MRQAAVGFGELLRTLRLKKNLSQAQLADACGLSQTAISLLESGKKHSVSRKVIERLIEVLASDEPHLKHRLLSVAGYSDGPEYDNPVARQIVLALNKPLLSSLSERLFRNFAKGWEQFSQAKRAQYSRDWEQSESLSEKVKERLDYCNNLLQAYVLDTIGSAKLHLGNFLEAESLYNQAEVFAATTGDSYIQGLIFTHQGDVARCQSRWEDARERYEVAQKKFDQAGDKINGARILRKRALVKLLQGDYSSAYDFLNQTLYVLQGLKDRKHPDPLADYELAKTYIALGWAHSLKGEWDLALSTREEALRITEQCKIIDEDGNKVIDRYLLMQGCLYYGYDCRMVAESDPSEDRMLEAEQYLRKAEEISRGLGDEKELGWILLGLARLFFAKGKGYWALAETYFDEARKQHRKGGDKHREAVTINHWAMFCLAEGKVLEARKLLYEAKKWFERLKNPYYLMEVSVHLGKVCLATRNFAELDNVVEDVMRQSALQNDPYPQHLARLKAIQAMAALDQGQVGTAFEHYADALVYAVQFNRYLCQEIEREVDKGLDKTIARSDISAAANYYPELAQAFEIRFEQSQQEFTYTQEQIERAESLRRSLTKKAENVAQDCSISVSFAYAASET